MIYFSLLCSMTTRKKKSRELQKRMNIVKSLLELKTSSYIGVYEFNFGLLTSKRRQQLYNIWNGRAIDEKIISNFEKLIQ